MTRHAPGGFPFFNDPEPLPPLPPAPPFQRLPTMTPIEGADSNFEDQGVARGPVVERFWLRPSPTFQRVGPLYPPGTLVTLLGRADRRSGRFGLYLVGVSVAPDGSPDRNVGWAALSAADIASVFGSRNDVALLRSYGKGFDGKVDPET